MPKHPNPRGPSPFRYPGGKQALVEYFKKFINLNGLDRPHLIEPFAGGAAVSLSLLLQDAVERVTLVERDPLVYAFWKCVKEFPDELCARIWTLSVTVQTWNAFQKFRADDALDKYPILDLAVAAIFFNRANFSGVIGAKPIGGMSQSSEYAIDCRWVPATLTSRICDIAEHSDRIEVAFGDAVSYLKCRKRTLLKMAEAKKLVVYIDPPYFLQGWKLYRYHFKTADHQRLAEFLNAQQWPWLVSYDNHQSIKTLFDGNGHKIVPFWLQYTIKQNRKADELLITNQQHLPSVEITSSVTTAAQSNHRIIAS